MIPPIQRHSLFANIYAQKQSALLSIPSEIVFGILRHIGEGNIADLAKSRLVCKKTCFLANDPGLCKTIYSRNFPSYSLPTSLEFQEVYSEIIRSRSNPVNGVYRSTTFKCGIYYSLISALLVSKEILVIGNLDKKIRLISLQTGKCFEILESNHQEQIAAFAIVNEELLSFSLDQTVQCWDMKTWKSLDFFNMGSASCKALTVLNGKLITGFEDGRIEAKELKTRKLLYTLPGEQNRVYSLFVSCGNALSISSLRGHEAQIKIWNLDSGECLRVWQATGLPHLLDVFVSHNDKLFTSFSGGGEILSWDIGTGGCIGSFKGHASAVTLLAILENNLISYSGDDGVIKVWDIEEKKCLKTFLAYEERIIAMNVVDERLFLCTYNGSVKLWDFQAEDDVILGEIAASLKTALRSIDSLGLLKGYLNGLAKADITGALNRFSRMPKKIKDQILSPAQIEKYDLRTAATVLIQAIETYLNKAKHNPEATKVLENGACTDAAELSKKRQRDPE